MRMPFEPRREDARELLKRDRRPPVLYLRSFEREAQHASRLRGMLEAFGQPLGGGGFAWGPQAQDGLRGVLSWVGPFVGLARPGDSLAHMGAVRLEVADSDWQRTVEDFLRRASFVVVGTGSTPGLRWELESLVRIRSPGTVLLIAARSKGAYREQCDGIARHFPAGLPPDMPPSRLVSFLDDWAPQALEVRDTLIETLCPFFRRNGVNYPANAIQAQVRMEKYGDALKGPMGSIDGRV